MESPSNQKLAADSYIASRCYGDELFQFVFTKTVSVVCQALLKAGDVLTHEITGRRIGVHMYREGYIHVCIGRGSGPFNKILLVENLI